MERTMDQPFSRGEAAEQTGGPAGGERPRDDVRGRVPADVKTAGADALCEWAEALGRSTESVRQAAELVRLLAERVRSDAEQARAAREEAQRLVAEARAAARAAAAEQEWMADEFRRCEARLRHSTRGNGEWNGGPAGW